MNQMMQMMQRWRAFQQFMQNPAQAFQQRGLPAPPQAAMRTPDGLIQYMLNSGAVTQDQYNQIQAQSRQLQQNPQFMQMLQGMLNR